MVFGSFYGIIPYIWTIFHSSYSLPREPSGKLKDQICGSPTHLVTIPKWHLPGFAEKYKVREVGLLASLSVDYGGMSAAKGQGGPPVMLLGVFSPYSGYIPLLQIRLWYDIPPKLCWFSFTPWIQKRSLYPPLTATSRQQWSHWDAIPKWLKLDTLSDEKSLIWIVIDHILWWLEWLQYV